MVPALVLAALALVPPPSPETAADELARRVDLALERASEDGQLGVLEAQRALRQLGPKSLPQLLLALGEERGASGSARARALLAALDGSGRAAVREAAQAVGSSPLGLAGVCTAFGELGNAGELRLLVELASQAAGRGELDVLLARGLERACAAICARDSAGISLCGDLLAFAHPRVRERLVLALGAEASDRRVESLSRALGLDVELDRLALAELGRLGLELGRGASERTLERIRPLLAARDPRLAGAAALALGRLGDTGAAGELVALLRRPEPELARMAHRALVALTGLGLRDEPTRWEAWYRGEERWWREQAPRWIERLSFEREGEGGASEALVQLGCRRLHRDEAAAAVLRVLGREDEALVVLACSTLAQLRSANALPALVDCLERPSESVREAAWRALVHLTQRELPPEPAAWRAILPG